MYPHTNQPPRFLGRLLITLLLGGVTILVTTAPAQAAPDALTTIDADGDVGRHSSVAIDDAGNPTTPGDGVIGRLARRGHIPLGYYKDEKKTAETFPTINGERWVVPGDMATTEADGTITLLGRGSVSINSGGEKIYPEEVELVLKGHPDVFDAVVVGVPDEEFGEAIAACVILEDGGAATADELIEHCRARIASYKKPRHVHFLDDLPRTGTGKVMKQALKKRLAELPSA